MSEINVYVEICREGVELSTYAKDGDAGMDIRAAEDIIINPQETVIIPTGLKVAIPKGYEIQVRPRSGISYKTPLRVSNAPGTVDSGFRNEIGVIMTNTSTLYEFNDETIENPYNNPPAYEHTLDSKGNKQGIYKIKKGDRIAQIVLKEVSTIKWKPVEDINTIGGNRGGGFGSSGVR